MQLIDYLSSSKASINLIEDHNDVICADETIEALLIASSFQKKKQKIVIVKSNLYKATKLYDALEGLVNSSNVLLYPSDESFRLEAVASSLELISQRIYCLNKVQEEDNYILITHTAALIRLLPEVELFNKANIKLKVGDVIKPTTLMSILLNSGYNKTLKIEHSLQFASRGEVIDIYSVNNELPIRIEFFDDEIESIRFFNLENYRTVSTVNEVSILPGNDLIIDNTRIEKFVEESKKKLDFNSLDYEDKTIELETLKDNPSYSTLYKYFALLSNKTNCLFDYTKDALVIYSNPDEINNNFNFLVEEAFNYLSDTNNTDLNIYYNIFDLYKKSKNKLAIKPFKEKTTDIDFNIIEVEQSFGSSKQLMGLIKEYISMNYKVVLCLDNTNQVNYIKDIVLENDISCFAMEDLSLPKHPLSYCLKSFKSGFELVNEKVIYLSSLEIFGVHSSSKKNYTHYKNGIKLQSYENLEVGDYVVHEDYGIGQYLGIETMNFDGIHKDYISIKYAGDRGLKIPLEQFKSIRKYVSKEGYHPKLSRLGGKEWENTKKRIKDRLQDVTQKLLNVYLERTKEIGFACQKDEEFQVEFENSFPYELTQDQKKVIEEIKKDMESPYPMDRIVCGDVGFGKTEVAFTAAFKAIVNGKQVALLCPTTLLARQHYEVAKQRFKSFPINIEVVSRLVPAKQIKDIQARLEKGEINLIIGTHKLLSDQIKYKDLGLLIIDEEQRFGVLHKEKIKELKHGIDVLTLSATPIPRTMQSALIGLRNLSQLTTPPSSRMPVQTYVIEKNYSLIKEIIERELGRHGQVFYLHNNIDTIRAVEAKLLQLLPGIRVGVIHGQMDKNIIEDNMIAFQDGKIDVLLCTSIIENGIDITNANTIIVDNADRFGLSQLYQIRGRVGRGDKLGYAYLLYSKDKELSEIASKRLQAIKEFTALGSGYRIALRDLTIRGAGDILGEEQAGFIDSVGIDMYISLLQEALDEAKNGKKEKIETVNKNLKVDAYVPEKFSNDDLDKIDIYKKITSINNFQDLVELKSELDDIYGKIPESVNLLLEKRRFEIFIQDKVLDDIIEESNYYELVLDESFSSLPNIGIEIFELCSKISRRIELSYRSGHIRVRVEKEKDWLTKTNKILNTLRELQEKYSK